MLMLVTRPEPDGQATMDRLTALGIASLGVPLMTRQTLSFNLPAPEGFSALAISSANALRSLAERDMLAPYLHLPVFAVGDRTANEARELGFTEITSAEGTLETLVTAIALAQLPGPVLYPSGRHLSGDLAHKLAPHGLMVVTVPVYEMVAEPTLPADIATRLAKAEIGAVLLYSRRTAEIFCALTGGMEKNLRRTLPILCLSEKVAEPLLEHHFSRIMLSDYPSEEGMMALALTFAREQTGS